LKSLEHGSSILTGNFLDFFRWNSVNFLSFPAGTGRNTASTKSPELTETGSFRTGLFDLGRIKGKYLDSRPTPLT
jgi:hypothetical protein